MVALITRYFKCFLGHDWIVEQEIFLTEGTSRDNPDRRVVIAWKMCKKCAKSKLIHILK